MKIGSLVTVEVVLLLLVTVCAMPKVSGQRYGGTLVWGLKSDPGHFNPAITIGIIEQAVSGQIYNALVLYDDDLNPISGGLAKSWSVSDDGKTYTFNLEHGVKWHDGVPFTSADVKFTVETVCLPLRSGIFGVIERVETPDDYTVIFKLQNPFSGIMKYLSMMHFGIMAKHIYENSTDIMADPHNTPPEGPIGTGPFKLAEWVRGDHIRLVKNEEYFLEDKPYVDEILIKIIPEDSVLVMALEKGEIDYYPYYVPFSMAKRLIENPAITVKRSNLAMCFAYALYCNFQNKYLSNLKVRQALAHAINKSLIVELACYGMEDPVPAQVPNITATDWFRSPNPPMYEYDLAKANQLLDEAGYPKGSDGIRFSLEIYPYTVEKAILTAEILRDSFREIGVDLKIKKVTTAAWLEAVYTSWEADLWIGAYAWGPDPSYTQRYLDPRMHHTGTFTCVAYNNTKMSELFDQAYVEPDLKKRGALYAEIENIAQTDLYAISLYTHSMAAAWRNDRFTGFPSEIFGSGRQPQQDVYWLLGEVREPTYLGIKRSVWLNIGVIVAIVAVASVAVIYWRRRRGR